MSVGDKFLRAKIYLSRNACFALRKPRSNVVKRCVRESLIVPDAFGCCILVSHFLGLSINLCTGALK